MKRAAVVVNRKLGGPFEKRPRGSSAPYLNITSLIDILTILLIFMLKNISMDSTQKHSPEGMLLPTAVTKNKLIDEGYVITVKIYPDKVLYGNDNIRVGSLDDFMTKPEIRSGLLQNLKEESELIKAHGNEPCLLIQADKSLDCRFITEFMRFSGRGRFANIYFSTINTDNVNEVLGL